MLHSSVFLTEFENKISVFKRFAGAKRQICRETNRSNGSARAHKSPSRPTITGYEAQVMRTCDLIALVTSIFDSYVIPLWFLCDSSAIPLWYLCDSFWLLWFLCFWLYLSDLSGFWSSSSGEVSWRFWFLSDYDCRSFSSPEERQGALWTAAVVTIVLLQYCCNNGVCCSNFKICFPFDELHCIGVCSAGRWESHRETSASL